MNPTTDQLLQSGLVITAWGMGLVFASLTLLWALLRLLTSVFQDRRGPTPAIALKTEETTVLVEGRATSDAEASPTAALTVERAHVAAVVAGAMLSNALPPNFGAAVGPAVEQGRIAPSWVTGNRARPVPPRQPSRVAERPLDRSRG